MEVTKIKKRKRRKKIAMPPKTKRVLHKSLYSEEERSFLIASLIRTGHLKNKDLEVKNYGHWGSPICIRVPQSDKAVFMARVKRAAKNSGMTANAWLVWQIKEIIEIHDSGI